MRITTRMMTNNMLSNINKNKRTMSKLEEQYSTGKKIQRPSDDPIVAVRALKLRTSITEIEQYYEKNIPDAESWMSVTESALDNINEILRKINTYCVQGSSDTLTANDRDAIVKDLLQLKEQLYQEGNANYAGRYVFTGYKTNSSLTFMENTDNLKYEITENFTGKDIETVSRVSGGYSLNDYYDETVDFDKTPQLNDIYRIKLSYDNLENKEPDGIQYSVKNSNGKSEEQEPINNIKAVSASDVNAYNPEDGGANFIYETGEIILSKSLYEKLRLADNIEIKYVKTSFEKGELKPEHYFDCVVTDTQKPEASSVTYTKTKQEIQYEVNFNQKLTVNTEASDAITHKTGRIIDDIVNCVNDVINTENNIKEVERCLENGNLTEKETERYNKLLEQLNTELTLRKEVLQKAFSRGIAYSGEEQDRVNVAVADLGSRQYRLQLTKDRLSTQKTDFKELLSNNEDADMAETIINYNSAYMVYTASLSASAKVVQTSLLDFL